MACALVDNCLSPLAGSTAVVKISEIGCYFETSVAPTSEDLYRLRHDGKAEIVNGEIVLMSPTGDMPGRAGGSIYMRLRAFERQAGERAYPDNVRFKVDLAHRKFFSPVAAFYLGKSSGMRSLEGAPVFAAEIRSETITAGKLKLRSKQSVWTISQPEP